MRFDRALATFVLLGFLYPSSSTALTAAETSCRDESARSLARYVGNVGKLLAKCHQRRSADGSSPGVDCNDVGEADAGARLPRAREGLRDDIVEACAGAESLLPSYADCPAPVADVDDGGATGGIDDFAEFADCVAALADVHTGKLFEDAAGSPAERLLSPLLQCQKTLVKSVRRIVKTILGERRRCQRIADGAGGGAGYSCEGYDARARVEKIRNVHIRQAAKRCDFSTSVLGQLEACSQETAQLIDCTLASADSRGSALIRAAYGLLESPSTTTTTLGPVTTTTMGGGAACGDTSPACDGSCAAGSSCVDLAGTCSCIADGTGPCAPATIIRTIHARYSGIPSMTTLSTGWSGKALDVDVPDHTGDTVDVTCDANCENCAIDLNTDTGNPASSCRCTSDSTQNCSVINGSDPASCGAVDPTCRCYFGAPLALSSGGTPACVVSRIRQDYAGTMNLRSGEWHDEIRLASVVYLGLSQTAPCPTCEGDVTPNDGVREGTCAGGISSNACDENGEHATFGPTSFDCLPASAANVSGAGLLIGLDASTGTQSLEATLPCQTPSGALCPCRVCTGNGNLGCYSDAQCAAAGAGTCSDAGGAGVNLNACDGFLCDADGQCTTGPIDTYCADVVHPDGRGFLPCSSDADCAAYSAGSCTVLDRRRCFPDPIVATGDADPYEPSSSALFCIAPTSNPGINITGGLPGPGKYVLSFTADIRCQNDPDLVYEFPSGANCESGSSSTTTTLLPLPPCGEAAAPLCGGVCPGSETCGDNGSGTCVCTSPPLPACDDATAPLCAGTCSDSGTLCQDDGSGACSCVVPTLPQCAEASSPLCGGLCPGGEVCQDVGGECLCGAAGAPACGTAVAPACAGVCDVGSACIASGDACMCTSLGLPTCAEASAPLCEGTCSLGSVCQATGGACQCVSIPLP